VSLIDRHSAWAAYASVVLALGAGAAGCRDCRLEHTRVAVPLEAEDLGRSCEEVCGEVINLLSDFTGCSEGTTEAGEPAAVCDFELEVCPSNSF
jgi:hypothetical protein